MLLIHPALRFLAAKQVGEVVCDQCQLDARWLKPTRLVGAFVDFSLLEFRRCRFRFTGLFCATGQPHKQLSGTFLKVCSGVLWFRLTLRHSREPSLGCLIMLCVEFWARDIPNIMMLPSDIATSLLWQR